MSKINLKDNIWIEGLGGELQAELYKTGIQCSEIIYFGKISEISEDLAKECVKWNHKVTSQTSINTGSGQTYKDYSGEAMWYLYTAKQSIQSACNNSEYCIIYRL